MSDQTVLVIVGALGFVINIAVLAVGGVWKLSRVEQAIRDVVAEHREEIDREFVVLRHEIGENLLAIRQKVTDVEIWGRDNYVKKDSFSIAMDRIEKNVASMGDRIETRLLRMETKIDRAAGSNG